MKPKGVTTQMIALDGYFLMVVFTLLLYILHILCVWNFCVLFDRETWQ